MQSKMRGRWAAVILLFPVLLALSLAVGVSGLTPAQMARALFSHDTASASYRIFLYVRLPRALAACMAGSALAVSGFLLQSVLRNPLASPGVIGVNSGAALCALLAAVIVPSASLMVPAAAFLGACAAAMGVYLLASLTGMHKNAIVLSGIAVGSLLGACMDAIVTLYPEAAISRSAFSIGGFSGVTLRNLLDALPFFIAGMLFALLLLRELSVLSLGDGIAQSLGLRVRACRFAFICVSALLTGCAVSFSGLIGFVGLIVPHIVRMLTGGRQTQLPMCIILGAELCMACDLIARTFFAPYELPVGIVLSAIGAPFFIVLLFRQGRHKDAFD